MASAPRGHSPVFYKVLGIHAECFCQSGICGLPPKRICQICGKKPYHGGRVFSEKSCTEKGYDGTGKLFDVEKQGVFIGMAV